MGVRWNAGDGGDEVFGDVLRAERRSAGLTLEELSESSGVSVRALSDMERGRALGPQRRTVELIAEALKLADTRRDRFIALARAGRRRSGPPVAVPGLCEPPGSIADFTGRAAELAWIYEQTGDPSGDRPGVVVISGGAGLGKTTLAVRAAHRLRDRFADGVLFVDALGMSRRPASADELLARLLRGLGLPDQRIPAGAAERAARYRYLLREKAVLVVVDDAAGEAQVRPLLPGEGGSRLLVTSRRPLAGLEGVQRLHLAPLPAADARDLLRRILAERADPRDQTDLDGLAELLGGLPLALRIAGNRLASRPQWSVGDLLARLGDGERRLDQLAAGDLRVAAAFATSYEQLSDDTRALFRRAALIPGADFGAALAAVAGGVPVPLAEDALDDLVDLGLAEPAANGRYRLHDLVRLYAGRRLEDEESTGAVATARRRMAGWLLETLAAAGGWFEPGRAKTGFASAEEAERWIRAEAGHWLPAMGAAALEGEHGAVVTAAASLHWFGSQWTHWPHWTELYTLAHDSAVALDDPGMRAEFLSSIAWTHAQPGREVALALEYAGRALDLAGGTGDVYQQGRAWQNIARARLMTGDPAAAMEAVTAAASCFERSGHVDAYCQTLLGRGDIALRVGRVEEALDGFERALAMVEDPGSGMTPSIAATTLPFVLGQTARAMARSGRREEGVPLARRAIDLFAAMDILEAQAMMLRVLGDDLYGPDQAEEARVCLLRAADIYASIGREDEAVLWRARAEEKAP